MDTLSGCEGTTVSNCRGAGTYHEYTHEIDERGGTLKLRVRRKRGNRKLVCSGGVRNLTEACDIDQREVRDCIGRRW